MTTIFRYVADFFAQSLVILYPPVLVFWIIMHTNIKSFRTWGKRAYWIVCLAWPLISGPLLFFRPELFSSRWEMPWPLAVIGVVLVVIAVKLMRETAKCIPHRTLVGLAELEPQKNRQPLLQSGIYAKTRNPVYLVHWLLILSAALMTGYFASWAFIAFDIPALRLLVFTEERELRERYGAEFQDYMSRVPRFFPKWP